MMEPVIGSARLFAAFENAGQSPGADLRGASGPSGTPADSVVRAFEEAMMPQGGIAGMKPAAHGTESAFWPEAGVTGGTAPLPAGPAEHMPAPRSEPAFRAEKTAWTETFGKSGYIAAPLRETQTLQSPVELYRTQYQIGLLRAHLNVVIHSSQSVTQSLETALKQSG